MPLLSLLSSALSSCGGPHLHIWYFEWFDSFFFFFLKLWMRKKWMAGADRRPKLMNWNVKWLPWSMIFVFVFPTNFSCFGRHFWLLTDCFSTHMVTAKDLQLLPPRTSRCLFLFIFFLKLNLGTPLVVCRGPPKKNKRKSGVLISEDIRWPPCSSQRHLSVLRLSAADGPIISFILLRRLSTSACVLCPKCSRVIWIFITRGAVSLAGEGRDEGRLFLSCFFVFFFWRRPWERHTREHRSLHHKWMAPVGHLRQVNEVPTWEMNGQFPSDCAPISRWFHRRKRMNETNQTSKHFGRYFCCLSALDVLATSLSRFPLVAAPPPFSLIFVFLSRTAFLVLGFWSSRPFFGRSGSADGKKKEIWIISF